MASASVNYWLLLGFPVCLALLTSLVLAGWAVYRWRREPYGAVVRGAERLLREHNVATGREPDTWPF